MRNPVPVARVSETPAATAAYYTLHTTDGHEAVILVPPGQCRWLIAVRYVNAHFLGSIYLADLTPTMPEEIAAFQAEYPHASFKWLADDP